MYEDLLKRVEDIAAPLLKGLGFRLIEREFISERGGWVLRLFIDKEGGGVTIGDCQKVSHVVGDAIDVEGIIDRAYTFEVSSPGVNRPLRFLPDFEQFFGEKVHLKTRYPIDGRSNYTGVLEGVEKGNIRLVIDGERYTIPHEAVARAYLMGRVEMGKKH